MSRNALSAILSELRVSGAIVLSQAHPIPWSIRVPAGNSLRTQLNVDNSVTVVPFHIARRGHFDFCSADGESIVVQANQLVMCANGNGHVMSSGQATKTQSFEQVMSAGSFDPDPGPLGSTEIICGVFMLRNTRHNPLIDALPSLVKIDISGAGSSSTMQKLNSMLIEELELSRHGQSYMLERVLEMLYAESIRLYTESCGEFTPNWLSAINDERIGKAINYIHANLAQSITIDDLAGHVALSPSRFSACFRHLVGVSPKSYIVAQRQAMAANRLLSSGLSIQQVADECGYRSMPSFTKAFIRQHGMTPSQWRLQQRK
ncbi:MAG: AraC family transcriptional regulator [Burkholderiaceae bacterium]